MTFTTTLTSQGVFGNKQYKIYGVSNDGTSGTVTTGLSKIEYAEAQNKTSATGIYVVEDVPAAGNLSITTASGDDFNILVLGRL